MKVENEVDVIKYEIEVARGNAAMASNRFDKVGEAAGRRSALQQTYTYTDTESDKKGVRYYRLKIIQANGSFRYSETKAVLFGDAVLWQVYPNPSAGKFNLVYQLNANEILVAGLYDAKGVEST